MGKFFDCGDKKAVHQVSFKDALASDKGAYGILNLYAYGIFKVQDYQKIDKINLSSIAGISDMVINLGLWMLFLIVFALLVLALTFALFTRAFYLWVIAIFSPMFGLLYFMEGKGKLAETFKGKADFATFIGLAMVPVYVSAALGFGLLFVKMAENAELTPENSSFFSDVKGGGGKPGESTFVIGSTADGKKATTITVSGMPTGVVESAGTGKDAAKGGVKLAASAIGKIIIGILALVVLWMSVMAALSSSEITKQAVEPISQFGSSMGKLAMDMPKYMPIPLGGGHKTSMKGLETMGSNISTAISQKAVGDSSQLGQSLGNKLAGAMGYQDTAVSKALNKMDQTLARINSSNLSSSDIDGKAKLARELVQ
ncbi:MAG: hypothetical protein QG650_647 [Patescibacteria group bacterium]|nr:hypothetical protein [Patescibacteria group bacterium]